MNERSDIRYYGTFKPERYAVGIALLSMDLVAPLQSCLRLASINLAETRHALRQAIIRNRQSLQKTPAIDPDLRNHVRSLLDSAASGRIEGWLDRSFIYRPDDFRRHSVLEDFFKKTESWDDISVPDRLRDGLSASLDSRPSSTCLYERYNFEYSNLSDWDSVILTRMGFYDENRDPFGYLNLTCGWLDFRDCLRWFVAQTSEKERSKLYRKIAFVAQATGRTQDLVEIMPIEDLIVTLLKITHRQFEIFEADFRHRRRLRFADAAGFAHRFQIHPRLNVSMSRSEMLRISAS